MTARAVDPPYICPIPDCRPGFALSTPGLLRYHLRKGHALDGEQRRPYIAAARLDQARRELALVSGRLVWERLRRDVLRAEIARRGPGDLNWKRHQRRAYTAMIARDEVRVKAIRKVLGGLG